jgi:DNA-directed RNA polymerase specialized sigma24 family protein
MHERVERLAHGVVSADEDLDREFDARLIECSTLAFRIAYSVLRHREDAEDVAQEARLDALERELAPAGR